MAKFTLNGTKNLTKRFTDMSELPGKVKKRLINQSANIVLSQLKQDAPKDTGKSAASLAIIDGRNGDEYLFLDVGIGKKNWEKCKGLWFQHYGFKDKSATLWMTSSFQRSKSKAAKIIRDGLKKEMNL